MKKARVGIIQREEIQIDQIPTHIRRRQLIILHVLCGHRTNDAHLSRIFERLLALNSAVSAAERAWNLVGVAEVADELRCRLAQMAFLLAGSRSSSEPPTLSCILL